MTKYPSVSFTEPFFKPTHPAEDSFLINKKFPIYAVADGVTLQIPEGKKYPRVSGAKMAADIFCKESVKFMEKKWKNLNFKKSLKNAFGAANLQIFNLNKKHNGSFSCTAALGFIKNDIFYGARLCDSGINVLDRSGATKFKSPEFWAELKRRGQNNYGVLNGKKEMLKFIDFYKIKLNKGDIVIIYTDGFENYFALDKFKKIFKNWENGKLLTRNLEMIVNEKSKKNFKLYGLEKTLIAVKYE
jgi:serine/threonine protein phosphatase PrpC